ncbi:MAG: hypothetical protein AAB353_08525, partial [Candidatus Hydrogenedentota bacterium]
YTFDSVHFGYRRLGGQSAPVLTVHVIGSAVIAARSEPEPVDIIFAMRRIGADRWLIVATLE